MAVLSLAHFTVIDADPLTLIDVAAAASFQAVGLRIVPPPGAQAITQVIGDAALQREIITRLRDTGVTVLDTEAIWLMPETDVLALQAALDTSAALGARYIIVCSNDPDRGRALTNFGQLCDMSHRAGIRVMLEFMPYTQIRSLEEACGLLQEVKPTDAGILVDALHLSRSGGRPSDLAAYDPALFNIAHLCDAAHDSPPFGDLRMEARSARLYPGEGALWLEDFVRAFSPLTAFAIEAPSLRHAALPPSARAKLAAEASRALLASCGPETSCISRPDSSYIGNGA